MLRLLCRSLVLAVFAVCGGVAPLTAAEPSKADWPQFLGPNRNGISHETGLNLDWQKKTPKVLWKAPLDGGCSSLTVVGDRLYTMTKRGNRDYVVCLDTRNGKEVWAYNAAPSYLDVQKHMAGPRSTPTFAHDKLYCLTPRGELICLKAADGKEVWKQDTIKAAGATLPENDFYFWGLSLSPLVEGDLVIVVPGGNKNRSVVAFHKDTGKIVWTAGDDPYAYASPVVITVAGKRMLVCPTGQAILGLDPAKGTVLWRYAFGNRFNATCATPVWADNLLFVSAAYGTGCAAVEIVPSGNKWSVKEKWANKNLQNIFATSMVLDGHLYGCHGDIGAIFLKCLDLKTGAVKWDQRQPGRCSLLAVGGHLVSLGERGKVQLIEANPNKYVLKGELDLLTPKAWAQPALADGRLYLRDEKQVICVDLRKE
jgi:outer membrane protein assembly factor BamB